MTHADLVERAARWLRSRQRCTIVLSDMRTVRTSEQPDVIGWRTSGWSVLVEVKTSASDFRRDEGKPCRRAGLETMGQERYYFAPAGLLRPEWMPEGWGLAELTARNRADVRITGATVVFDAEGRQHETRRHVHARSRAEVPFLLAAIAKFQNGHADDLTRALNGGRLQAHAVAAIEAEHLDLGHIQACPSP